MDMKEKTVSKNNLYRGRIINVHVDTVELPNGNRSLREVVDHPGGVCVVAITDENELLFVRQFRYPYSETILELPAGKLEPGSTPLENGKRELKEETGAEGEGYISLGKLYPSPGYCGEIIHMYACHVHNFGSQHPDDDEILEVKRIPLKKAVAMVLNNQIADAKTQTAVLKTHLLIQRGIL